ncbi:hypothetical protein A4A49_03208 [Nicotiana attenuata]|uniref:Uncharacterized protein n=1 Tax=Nicotiana attenuata TaxID=49451 RepID=A0A1J6IR03_NICAT|nr:hypothetical protein A4A49_03208 [Nicotiana attenuata]
MKEQSGFSQRYSATLRSDFDFDNANGLWSHEISFFHWRTREVKLINWLAFRLSCSSVCLQKFNISGGNGLLSPYMD